MTLTSSSPPHNISNINDLLKIHALKKKPLAERLDSQSPILKVNPDLTYQVRATAKRLKNYATGRVATQESDLALMDQEDEELSEV